MTPARLPLFPLLIALAGCATPPALDGRISAAAAAAPYPTLQPLAPLLARASAPPRITPQTTGRTQGAAAGLRDRAAALRGPVVDGATRTRMNQGVARAALR